MPQTHADASPPSPARPSWARKLLQIALTIGVALGIAWACGKAMALDARLTQPPGLFRGMLHGAMMPVAWPALLAGHDQEIYAARNSGRLYKAGYSMGVNLSGLIFFGWLFLTVGSLRELVQRKKPE